MNPPVTSQPPNRKLSFPALRSLGQLAEAQPIITIDSREQVPLVFTRLQSVQAMLSEGDYSILGVPDFCVERKGSLDELASCCIGSNRDRIEREFFRLRPYRFKRLLVVGASCERDVLVYPYRSRINPRAVVASLFCWQSRFDLPYVLVPSAAQAARLIETWSMFHCREVVHSANGLLRAHWRSAKARIPAAEISEPEPPEPAEEGE